MARHSARKAGRAKLSPLSVIGELLIVGGLAVVGYLLWQPWYTTTVVADEQARISAQTAATWREAPPREWEGDVPVAPKTDEAEVFGVLYVPAFGATYANQIAEGVSEERVLNLAQKGVGHYPTSSQLGEPGNFAVAAHRSGPFTTPFKRIMNLRVGDPLFIETPDGWYTYRFRSLEYVLPDESNVLHPFPRQDTLQVTDRLLTLTTCHPENLGIDERAVAYSVFESFQPHSEGVPAELLKLNPTLGEA